ncbi:MAG TPA: hypothetical protein VL593_00550 [Ramlibacter sp.]|jgi:hypothetical protein|nr:hypothetical protein [Ramlibacter sp.]
MKLRHSALALAMLASLGLVACHRGSTANEHGAQGEPTAKGVTGSGSVGTSAMGGPGSGLNGGLAPRGSASMPTGVAEGSTNRTLHGSVGNR